MPEESEPKPIRVPCEDCGVNRSRRIRTGLGPYVCSECRVLRILRVTEAERDGLRAEVARVGEQLQTRNREISSVIDERNRFGEWARAGLDALHEAGRGRHTYDRLGPEVRRLAEEARGWKEDEASAAASLARVQAEKAELLADAEAMRSLRSRFGATTNERADAIVARLTASRDRAEEESEQLRRQLDEALTITKPREHPVGACAAEAELWRQARELLRPRAPDAREDAVLLDELREALLDVETLEPARSARDAAVRGLENPPPGWCWDGAKRGWRRDLPFEMTNPTPEQLQAQVDESWKALEDIARICGRLTWHEPYDVVSAVRSLEGERDALNSERGVLRNELNARRSDALRELKAFGIVPKPADEALSAMIRRLGSLGDPDAAAEAYEAARLDRRQARVGAIASLGFSLDQAIRVSDTIWSPSVEDWTELPLGGRIAREPLGSVSMADPSTWPKDQGRKDDTDKADWSVIPWGAMERVVRVFETGVKRYGRENWRLVEDGPRRYFSATMRHLLAWRGGQELDPTSGLPHLAHAIACLLIAFERERIGVDG
jgi:hypothetical protein